MRIKASSFQSDRFKGRRLRRLIHLTKVHLKHLIMSRIRLIGRQAHSTLFNESQREFNSFYNLQLSAAFSRLSSCWKSVPTYSRCFLIRRPFALPHSANQCVSDIGGCLYLHFDSFKFILSLIAFHISSSLTLFSASSFQLLPSSFNSLPIYFSSFSSFFNSSTLGL